MIETFEAIQRFFASYPLWARTLAAVGFAVGFVTLLLAPRSNSPPGEPSSQSATPTPTSAPPGPPSTREAIEPQTAADSPTAPAPNVWLVVERVELFPPNPDAEIQVTAFVNDTQFRYPSVAGVEWLNVGPGMSSQRFRLPQSRVGYNIRFEMLLRADGAEKRFASQETEIITSFPSEGTYNLHQVSGFTRAANVAAAVIFSVRR